MSENKLGGKVMEFVKNKGVYKKADEILKNVNVENDKMIDTDDIKKAVETLADCKINISKLPFNQALGNDFCNFGAITSLVDKNSNTYRIIINSEKDIVYQRFSLIHEFGHIVLNAHNFSEGKFVISTHINYDLNHVDNLNDAGNTFLQNEELANIFALCVLLPEKSFTDSVYKNGVEETALKFGVSNNAVISRLRLLTNN